MASSSLNPTASGDQPELRAVVIYDRMPPNCIPHLVPDDESEPILHAGEVIIVDVTARQPIAGELLAIEYGRSSRCPTRDVVELRRRPNGSTEHVWFAGAYNRPRSLADGREWAAHGRVISCSDGPYPDTDAGRKFLGSQLIGRVVGVLQQSFSEPKRLSTSA